jgi:hypothetical protein
MLDILIKIAGFSGLISTLLIPIGLAICIKNYKGFDYFKYTVCDCARQKEYGSFFNFTLASFGILELLFSLAIMDKFSLLKNTLLVSGLFLAVSMTLLAAIFPINKFKRIHFIFGYLSFIILIPWAICLHICIIGINKSVGYLGSLISLLMGFGTILMYIKYKECSIPELYFIAFVMLWNLFFSYILLFY